MQNARVTFSVSGVVLLLVLHLQSSSATTIEDLLDSEDTHEVAAHAEFTSWCRDAQAKLTDRVSAQSERINELNGAIASYTEKSVQLKNVTKNSREQPLEALSQDQRLKLIETESQHWRSIHAREAAEHLLKADKEFLDGISDALKWEEKTLSQHQSSRQQLLTLVREHGFQEIAQPHPASSAPVSHAATTAPQAGSENLIPQVSPHKAPVQATVVQALPQEAQVKKHVEKLATIRAHAMQTSSPAADLLLTAAAPMLGISQLPALQLMQQATHPLPPPAPAPETQPAAALLTPMLPHSTTLDAPALSPLLSLAGIGTRSSAQASAIADLSSQPATAEPAANRLSSTSVAASPTSVPLASSPKVEPPTPAAATKTSAPVAMSLASTVEKALPVLSLTQTPSKSSSKPMPPAKKKKRFHRSLRRQRVHQILRRH
jgi:hypothetical protein